VGPTAIYSPFSKLPLTIPGAQGIHFSNRLQPWDQRPATYIIVVLGSLFILSPWGAFFFFISWSGTYVHCQIYLIYAHILDSLQILFTLGIWLFCVHVLDHHPSTSFLQVYTQHWHVVSPAVLHLHFQSHPLILTFRIPIPGSAVLTPPFASSVLLPVSFLTHMSCPMHSTFWHFRHSCCSSLPFRDGSLDSISSCCVSTTYFFSSFC
jgi:hypothetical protein